MNEERIGVSLQDMIRDVGRELGMRRSCYPKWVAGGRMTQAEADHRLACMDAVYALLKATVSSGQAAAAAATTPAASTTSASALPEYQANT